MSDLEMPKVCCQEYETCKAGCVPRLLWEHEQDGRRIADAMGRYRGSEPLIDAVKRLASDYHALASLQAEQQTMQERCAKSCYDLAYYAQKNIGTALDGACGSMSRIQRESYLHAGDAILSLQPAQQTGDVAGASPTLKESLVSVPREPTDEMAWAICATYRLDGECMRCPKTLDTAYGAGTQACRHIVTEVYKAMIAAAPKEPA